MITNLTCNKCKSKENLPHKKLTTFSRVNNLFSKFYMELFIPCSFLATRNSLFTYYSYNMDK